MYIRIAQKANALLYQYKIKEFPIPYYIIEQIFEDQNIKIVLRNNLKFAAVIGDELLIRKCSGSDYRHMLSHEYLHVNEHVGNYFTKDRTVIAKDEAQANAFAAYFLMPVGMFEESLKHSANDFELAEEYGVTIELVQLRKELTKALLESGQLYLLKKAIYKTILRPTR